MQQVDTTGVVARALHAWRVGVGSPGAHAHVAYADSMRDGMVQRADSMQDGMRWYSAPTVRHGMRDCMRWYSAPTVRHGMRDGMR